MACTPAASKSEVADALRLMSEDLSLLRAVSLSPLFAGVIHTHEGVTLVVSATTTCTSTSVVGFGQAEARSSVMALAIGTINMLMRSSSSVEAMDSEGEQLVDATTSSALFKTVRSGCVW